MIIERSGYHMVVPHRGIHVLRFGGEGVGAWAIEAHEL